jgi:maltooligosyltrehalose trehalohydrolase
MTAETFGPLLTRDGVTFRLWAPAAKSVRLLLDKPHPMEERDGWYTAHVPEAKAGTRYQFEIDGDLKIPDPASRFQPDDINGTSEVTDQAYAWKTQWTGRPWAEAVFCEIHVGTCTPEGTYRGLIDKLDHFAETGITALQIMPLADFPGRWNWGYDGVLLFAPDAIYGRPEDLKALIDAAHARGLMVFLDVVYNHFGPEGNYLHAIAPQAFSQEQTPWGGAIDYRRPEMRALAIENAVYWLRDYRFDGLRLDAVHAIVTPGEPHILHDLSNAVGALARETGRHLHLVLENDDNRASLLDPIGDPAAGKYRAQWNDDYHHAWHALLTGETSGYYKDYDSAGPRVARSLAEGFVYQGEPSRHRKGALRGEPSAALSSLAFVNFLQNHDQIGNRARGERLTTLAKPESIEAAHAILLLSPAPPMLFMGEEWGATEPFPFFCDFTGDLAEAVRNGRKKEFSEAYADALGDVPDPLAESTVALARLDWRAAGKPDHAERLRLTRELLRVRREHIVPFAAATTRGDAEAMYKDGVLSAHWRSPTQRLSLLANLTDAPADCPQRGEAWGEPIWGGKPPAQLPPWSVFVALGDA